MYQLPEYQNVIYDTINEIEPFVKKYAESNSPLGDQQAKNLSVLFSQAKAHCHERINSKFPKIMLYGVYNSGKSTLLNALIGEERAEVGDIPKTDHVTPYQWKGYELLDTPGINAPIKHQEISYETLAKCQVIIFVISAAGSFEDKTIFEAMRNVVQKGKHLFIVLNEKEGRKLQGPEVAEIKNAIQDRLINVGFTREKAAAFRLYPVNAQFALTGRLENDENLVKASGIYDLERRMLEEIKRVNGFDIVIDLCRYLSNEFSPFIEQLDSLGKEDNSIKVNDFIAIRKEYSDFKLSLENKINDECATMPSAIMNCFPSPEQISSSNIDPNGINNKIRSVFEKYGSFISSMIQQYSEGYKYQISRQLQRLFEIPQLDGNVTPSVDDDIGRSVHELLSKKPMTVLNQNIAVHDEPTDTSFVDDIENFILKLPLPQLPKIPLEIIVKIFSTLIKSFIGDSDAERRRRQIEQEAEARRNAEEEHARNVALWRQQLVQQCQDITRDFVSGVKKNMYTFLDSIFGDVLKNAEDEFGNRNLTRKDIFSDAVRLHEIFSKLDIACKDLQYQDLSFV